MTSRYKGYKSGSGGWFQESRRHSLARRGIKTGSQKSLFELGSGMADNIVPNFAKPEIKGQQLRIRMMSPKKCSTVYGTQDVGKKGKMQRVACKKKDDGWETQSWRLNLSDYKDKDSATADLKKIKGLSSTKRIQAQAEIDQYFAPDYSRKKAGFMRSMGTYPQVGKTHKAIDKPRHALPAGWRIASSGSRYFENRRNRSDNQRTHI